MLGYGCAGLFLLGLFTFSAESRNFQKVEWRFGPLITLENLSTEKPKSTDVIASTPNPAVPLKEEVCRQPPESGLCYASISRFYFHFENKTCEHFYWGGCNKNDNNFATKEECDKFCKDVV